jgi:hypothetical protein
LIHDDDWPVARLIPISSASGIEAQERRAASALLAVLTAVDEFGRALLRPLGAPNGKISAFIEVPMRLEDDRLVRPDGLIVVSRGSRSWSALVEVKTARNKLEPAQVEAYIDLARQNQCDALLTISNQYATRSTEYPIALSRRKLGKVRVHHWSWVQVLTEAVMQKQYRGVKDPDQAYILQELIRYLSDPRSGAVQFDDMGPGWGPIREGVRLQTLKRSDPHVEAVCQRWDELVQYLCLDLAQLLGSEVRQVTSAAEQTTESRLAGLKAVLVDEGRLGAQIKIPSAAGPVGIVADLKSRQVLLSTHLDAPSEGLSKGRTSWLLRQLPNAPVDLAIEVRLARSSQTLVESLKNARERPSLLYPDNGREIRQFRLTLARDMGLKRGSGRGSFIGSVLQTTQAFYANVLQDLRAWKPRPPRLAGPLEDVEPHELVPLDKPAVRAAVEQAEVEGESSANRIEEPVPAAEP